MVPGIEACLDGYVGMATITTAQWHTFLDMIERPDLASDVSLYIQRNRERPDVLEAIGHWTGRHTVDEVVEIGALYRIPTVPIGNGANFPRIDHVASRQLYDPNPRGGFPHPRTPFRSNITRHRPPGPAPTIAERARDVDVRRSSGTECTRTGPGRSPPGTRPTDADAGGLPLADIRILDFTAFLAGPMCTQYLASLGADVVKVESTQRPDPMRFSVRVDTSVDHWYEQGAIFQSANLNKRSVTLDLSDARGRDLAFRLAARSDVVVENFTPRVMEQFDLSYDDLRAVNPRIIMVRMPGFGLEGPWRDRPGFAASMEQVSGLAWITGYTDGLPSIPGICDPLAGMHAAFAVLTALEHRARTGEGQLIELAMIDLAANLVVEQVLEHSVYGQPHGPAGEPPARRRPSGRLRLPSSPTSGLPYESPPTRPGAGCGSALGSPAWSLDTRLDTVTGRSERADLLDAELASWFAGQSQKEALATLRAAGVECRGRHPRLRRRPRRADERPRLLGGGHPPDRGSEALSRVADALRLADIPVVPATGATARPAQRRGAGEPGRHRGRARGAGRGRASSAPGRSAPETRWPNPAPSTGCSPRPAPSAVASTSTAPSTSIVVLDCLDLALQAPTGGDFQGWRWIVITEPDTKARVRDIYLDALTAASGGRRRAPADRSARSDARRGLAPGHSPRPGARPRPGLHSGADHAGHHPGPGLRSLRIDLPGGLESAAGPAEPRTGLDDDHRPPRTAPGDGRPPRHPRRRHPGRTGSRCPPGGRRSPSGPPTAGRDVAFRERWGGSWDGHAGSGPVRAG